MKRLIVVFIVLLMLCYSCFAGATSESTTDINNVIGTYIGLNGSSLVIYEDGTADYFWKDWKEVESGDTWKLENSRLFVSSKSMGINFYADIPEGVVVSLLFQADSILWDDECYIHISPNAKKMSKAEHLELIKSYLKTDVDEESNTDSSSEALKLEMLHTDHFSLSVPADWPSSTEDHVYRYHLTGNGKHEQYYEIEENDSALAYSNLNPDTVLDAYISNINENSNESISYTYEKTIINELSTVVIKGNIEGNNMYILTTFDKGYLLIAKYVDDNPDSTASWNTANSLFSTIQAISDTTTAPTPEKERTLREGKYIIGKDITPGYYTITCVETIGESVGNAYGSLGNMMDALDENSNGSWGNIYGSLGDLMGEYMNMTVEILGDYGDVLNSYDMKEGDSFTIKLEEKTAIKISDGSCVIKPE